jgi:EmrB/QacA subfamily drug resistance transporter
VHEEAAREASCLNVGEQHFERPVEAGDGDRAPIVAATMHDRGHRASVLIACTGAFLVFLDTTIVNIAFPDISASFPEASRGLLSWVLDGYFVVIAALLVPAGGLADRFGHKRVFLWGLGLFTLTSLLCAMAPSLEALIAFRVLQGAGAAAIAPTSLAIVLDSFPSEKRATGVGLWGAAAAAAAATGPTLGAALVELDSWRLVFLVNLPLGAALLLAGFRLLPDQPLRDSRLPDLPGALALALGLAAVTLGIVEGNDWGWTSAGTLGAFAAASLLLAIVVVRSLRHPRPIVEPALFSHRSFSLGNLGTLLFAAAFFSLILGNVLFLTTVWGYSILSAGLASLPGPAMTTVVSGPAGRLADRFGHRAVIVPGTLVFAAGAMVLRSAGAEPDYLGLWLPGAILTGIGIGLAFPTLGSAAVRDVADDRFATASAVNAAFRQVGAVLGTAILIAIVGEPASLAEALDVSNSAYLFAALAALAAGALALTLRRAVTPATYEAVTISPSAPGP